ncbi:MAG: DUF4097 family beta strand repeat protein [Butyrivibrio sp.]|nr:DUF4097 family beta strand repeat protein [Butyrivibrio sp.]
MKKYSMAVIAFAVICVIVGIAFSIKKMPKVAYSNDSSIATETEEFGEEEVKEVKVNMDHGHLSLVYGAKLEVVSKQPVDEMPTASLENGVLTISQEVPKKDFSIRVSNTEDAFSTTIVVPEGTVLTNTDVNADEVDVKIQGVKIENMTFNIESGDVDITDSEFASFKANITDYGDITVDTQHDVDMNNFSAFTNHGDVVLNGHELSDK